MQQDDLFDAAHTYPNAPGFQNTDTSKDAALAVKEPAVVVRMAAIMFLGDCGERGGTAQEVADGLGLKYETVQPRLSELRAKGKIADSGQRRESRDRTKKAIVWILK